MSDFIERLEKSLENAKDDNAKVNTLKAFKTIPKTWTLCKNERILQIRDEVWAEAVKLGYVDESTKPVIVMFSSSNKWGEAIQYAGNEKIKVLGLEKIFLKDPESVKKTMAHEIAHLCSNGDNHGKKWRQRGNEIGKLYNITMSVQDSTENLGINGSLMKYHLKCTNCGNMCHWNKITKAWKEPKNLRCGKCMIGKFERFYYSTNPENNTK